MSLRRRFFLSFVFVFFFPFFSHAQFAVIDVSAIAAAIENGYTMYQQLMNAYQQYQNQIQQLENERKKMASMSVSDYDWKKWDSAVKMTDDYMTRRDNIRALYDEKCMHVGNTYFSISDLYRTNTYDRIAEDVNANVNPANITVEQKAQFYNRHGMSYEHYYALHGIVGQLGEVSKKVLAFGEITKDKNNNAEEIAADQAKNASNIESDTALLQAQLQAEAKQLDALLQAARNTQAQAELVSLQMQKDQEEINGAVERMEKLQAELDAAQASTQVVNSVGTEDQYRGFKSK